VYFKIAAFYCVSSKHWKLHSKVITPSRKIQLNRTGFFRKLNMINHREKKGPLWPSTEYTPDVCCTYSILDREQSLGKKEGLPTAPRNEYAAPTQRKIPIGRNRCACQSHLICSNIMLYIISRLNVDFINEHHINGSCWVDLIGYK
jgi:hypothetical protein